MQESVLRFILIFWKSRKPKGIYQCVEKYVIEIQRGESSLMFPGFIARFGFHTSYTLFQESKFILKIKRFKCWDINVLTT